MNASTEEQDTGQPRSGPWTYTRHDREAWVYGPARTFYTVDDADGAHIASGITDEAKARLIAAAPDMAALLEDIVRHSDDDGYANAALGLLKHIGVLP